MNFNKLFKDYSHQITSCVNAIEASPTPNKLIDSFILVLQLARDKLLLTPTENVSQEQMHLLQVIQQSLTAYFNYHTCREKYFDSYGHVKPEWQNQGLLRTQVLARYAMQKEVHWQNLWNSLEHSWFNLLED